MLILFLQIRDSNRAMVLAAALEQQCKVFDLGIAHDDKAEIERALESAVSSGVDLIITSGGVSMGDRDYVKPLLRKKGKMYFDKVMFFLSFPPTSTSAYAFFIVRASKRVVLMGTNFSFRFA